MVIGPGRSIPDLLGHSSIGVTSAIYVEVLRKRTARCGRPARSADTGQIAMPTQHHECGEGRFLWGSTLTLCLLPELDLNQQPCD